VTPAGATCEPVEGCLITTIPDVLYARSGGVAVAYQVVGQGPTVVYAPHLCTIDALWRVPYTRRLLAALSEQTRLIVFNPRGTGLSDRPRGVTLESRMDDIVAILEATGTDRITLFGVSESANVCALFASTYPERCEQLVLFMPYIMATPDPEEGHAWVREMREHWGERAWMAEFASGINPAYGSDPELLDWFIWMQRAAASPASVAEFARMQVDTDMRDVLPAIRVPTVVLHRAQDRDDARAFAEPIHGAEIMEVSGIGYDPYHSADEIAGAVVARARLESSPAVPETVLTTLLFTDLTDSTATAARLGDRAWRELLDQHHRDVRRDLGRFRGMEIDSAGDGFFCRFDGPARAIACARAIIESAATRGLTVRAGVHTGECELVGSKPAGIAVHIGARMLGEAGNKEIVVTSTVRDLVAGSGFTFEDRGEHELKGVPGAWRLFAVEP